MCLHGDLARAPVHVLMQYFGTCVGASNNDVFHFALERFIYCNKESSELFCHSRRHVHKTLLQAFSRSIVAPHIHQ